MPFDISDRYAQWRWTVAWDWTPDAPTYLMTRGDERRFVKLAPAGNTLPDEATRLRFAGNWAPVPELIEYGSDGETDWLMTAALPGADATKHPWFASDPGRLSRALGEGLRRFHSLVPVNECPFDFTAPVAVSHVQARFAAGLITLADLHKEYQHLGVEGAVERLVSTQPEVRHEVVAHGDYCLPNVFFAGDVLSGYLDMGKLAIADPWWDLAVGSWSVSWNLGPIYQQDFFDGYGILPDEERIAWYRLLYDLA
jgi:kanamycin kinase